MNTKGGEYNFMEERYLLLDKQVETETRKDDLIGKPTSSPSVRQALPSVQEKSSEELPERLRYAFSSRALVKEEEIETEASIDSFQAEAETLQETKPEKEHYSSTIDSPNYDFIEELTPQEAEKVYKLEREKSEAKPKNVFKKLRLALFSLIAGVCLVWGIVNTVQIAQLQDQINLANQEYQLKLGQYLSKLATLDSVSSYNELFETTPEEMLPPASMPEKSNWFDRFCNFITGIFGG